MMRRLLGMLLPRSVKKRIRTSLLARSLSVSQAGQDLWVLGEAFNLKEHGFFVDVGAFDGLRFSNTYLLEKALAWRGVCVEADPKSFDELKKNRTALCLCSCVDGSEGTVDFAMDGLGGGIVADDTDNDGGSGRVEAVPTRTLDGILHDAGAPKIIDYLSIDVEGAEERILRAFPFDRFTFRTMTVERPSPALRAILEKNAYALVKEIPQLDCFYVHGSFLQEYATNTIAFYRRRHVRMRWPSGLVS